MKKVCYFGIYDPHYSRNKILIRGWKENGYEVVECNVDPRKYPGIKKYIELYKKYKTIKHNKFESVIVGFPGHSVVWLARILFGKVVFDAFLSLYDSNVFDRKLYSKYSLRGIRDYFLDFYSIHLASKVLLDTHEHAKFFRKKFHANNFIVIPVGADTEVFYPRKVDIIPNLVHFHGSDIPLQGIDYIIKAAEILPEVSFVIIGRKAQNTKNITFIHRVPLEELPSYIAPAAVCLGIFGNTDKAKRVIPNKVYEYAAMNKRIITADTPAIREMFSENDIIFCKLADPVDLAKKIKESLNI